MDETRTLDLARGGVIVARRRREMANEEYRSALELFLAAGGTYVELGRLLGVSRQAVRQQVERGRRS